MDCKIIKVILLSMLGIMVNYVVADTKNNSLQTDLNPSLPVYTKPMIKFKAPLDENLFDASRLQSGTNLAQRYNLNQLQMVGFMHYKGQNYAFLKTPFEVIKVKAHDKLQNAEVIKVDNTGTEIRETQVDGNKVLENKLLVKFNFNESHITNYPKLK